MNVAIIFEVLKYFAAHTAGFGGLATAIVALAHKDYNGAWVAFLAAMAGFGINLKPSQQANTK